MRMRLRFLFCTKPHNSRRLITPRTNPTIRKQFRTRGIKVCEEITDSDGVVARYKCRGYESEFRILWSMMAPQAAVIMRKYLGVPAERIEGERPFVTVPPKLTGKDAASIGCARYCVCWW